MNRRFQVYETREMTELLYSTLSPVSQPGQRCSMTDAGLLPSLPVFVGQHDGATYTRLRHLAVRGIVGLLLRGFLIPVSHEEFADLFAENFPAFIGCVLCCLPCGI